MDRDGIVVLREWTFGDAETGPMLAAHEATFRFPRSGVYHVTHEATDNMLESASLTRVVVVANRAPVANFTAAPQPAFRHQPVAFADASSDPDGDAIVAWAWDFGDGAVAHTRDASHAYDALGTYTVTLTVTDAEGQSSMASLVVRVLNAPPRVIASMSPSSPAAGQQTTFSADGTDPDGNGPLSYAWTFSDGVKLDGRSVVRTFAAPGTYAASVVARDEEGGASSPAQIAFQVSA